MKRTSAKPSLDSIASSTRDSTAMLSISSITSFGDNSAARGERSSAIPWALMEGEECRMLASSPKCGGRGALPGNSTPGPGDEIIGLLPLPAPTLPLLLLLVLRADSGERKGRGILLLCTDEEVTGHSDDGGVRQRFAARYGDRLVQTTPSTYDRSDPAAIEDALVDLWLLRSTTAFVGSDYSGFSELAVFGRDVPYRMVGDSSAAWKRLAWLSRFGLFNRLLRRLGRREFGVDRPLPFLIEHYSRKWLG
jgi:hypothetical protein